MKNKPNMSKLKSHFEVGFEKGLGVEGGSRADGGQEGNSRAVILPEI